VVRRGSYWEHFVLDADGLYLALLVVTLAALVCAPMVRDSASLASPRHSPQDVRNRGAGPPKGTSSMRIAVAGGTGVAGRLVVEEAAARGYHAVVLARSAGVDLVTGRGLPESLRGADALIDVSNVQTVSRRRSRRFFRNATENLLRSSAQAGVRHLVTLSIVGIDRVDFGYYEGKRIQEALVESGDTPYSILRATQFFEFPGQLLQRSPGPVAVVSGDPAGRLPELGGPEVLELPDMARSVLHATGRRAFLYGVRLPGSVGRAMATGGLLPEPGGPRSVLTFDQWLRATVA
jgi:uncharacterized protein YbjT (DUF2867 family)